MQYDSPIPQTKEMRMELEMASWIYQSHLWKKGGIAEDNIICEWCGKKLMGPAALTTADSLCLLNPKIREMRTEWIKHTMKGMVEAKKIIEKSREGLCQES